MSPAESVATALAPLVRANGWFVDQSYGNVFVRRQDKGYPICTINCVDESQAKRLAEMMRGTT